MGRILAIDFGQKRTGLAVTDMLRLTANPLLTVETNQLFAWLDTYLASGEVDDVVIGHPVQMNGQDSDSMRYITPFMNQFIKRYPSIPLHQFDERFTSVLAHRAIIESGIRKSQRRDKTVVDKVAACIILEDYMNSIQ